MRSLTIVNLATVLLLASAGVTAAGDYQGPGDHKSTTCVNKHLIRSFDAIGDKHLFVEERRKKYYLIILQSRGFNLQSANAIAIADSMSIVCAKGFGTVVYRDSLSGRLESSHIDTIERVESLEVAKAIVAAKAAARKADN